MEIIKKYKIIISMVASIIVSFAIFFFGSFIGVQDTKSQLQEASPETERQLRDEVARTPKNKMIKDLKLMHEQIRKSRIRILEVLFQSDKPLEMRFPDTDFNNISSVMTRMDIYIAALKDFYLSFMHSPSDLRTTSFGTGLQIPENPFNIIRDDMTDEESCRLAMKKLMVTIELVNALHRTVEQLKELSENSPPDSLLARFKSSGKNLKPRCAILDLRFPSWTQDAFTKSRDVRTNAGFDGTKFYTTLPFTFNVILEPEAVSLFTQNLSVPEGLNIRIAEFPEISERRIDEEKERLLREKKVTEEDLKERIEQFRQDLELKRKKDEFEQIKRMLTVDKRDLELESSNSAVRQRYGIQFDFLSVNFRITPLQLTLNRHLLRDNDAREAYIRTFPDDIGLDRSNPLPPQGREIKDHEGRFRKTHEVRQELSKILVPMGERGPAYFVVNVSGAVIDWTLDELIKQILIEEEIYTTSLISD